MSVIYTEISRRHHFHFVDVLLLYVAIPLSIDHKPDRSDERERIEKAGGFIVWAGKFLNSHSREL